MMRNNFSSTCSIDWLETIDQQEEVQKRLSLYQVFCKLYEHHRGLLDEILSLENSSNREAIGITAAYIQGIVYDQGAYLVTNLLQGKTQGLLQPQHTWVIGRDRRQVSLPIPDKRLSRCHAAIKYIPTQGFYLIDLESRNGTFVNGEPIRQPYRLQDGDQVRLGCFTFSFFICQSAQTAKSLPLEAFTALRSWQPGANRAEWSEQDADIPTEGVVVEEGMMRESGSLDDTCAFAYPRFVENPPQI